MIWLGELSKRDDGLWASTLKRQDDATILKCDLFKDVVEAGRWIDENARVMGLTPTAAWHKDDEQRMTRCYQ